MPQLKKKKRLKLIAFKSAEIKSLKLTKLGASVSVQQTGSGGSSDCCNANN